MDKESPKPADDMPATSTLRAEDVRAYLLAHPDFLVTYPEVMHSFTPPDRSESDVVDFQHYAIKSLQQQVRDSKDNMSQIIGVARDTKRLQQQVQMAVVHLVRLTTLEAFFECLCIDFPPLFGVDVVRLGLESDMAGYYESYYPEDYYSGMVLIQPGMTAALCHRQHPVQLMADTSLDGLHLHDVIFHHCTDLAHSTAYMALPLPHTGRQALLAFGVRERGRFQAGQNTEALEFLATIAALTLDKLLYQQAGVV